MISTFEVKAFALYCFVQQKWRKAYFDGGGGTPPATKCVTESLNTALQQTIKSFGLQSIAEPFCQCDINATMLHMYRLVVDDVYDDSDNDDDPLLSV